MGTLNLLTLIGGIMLSLISYFLKKTMDDLKEVKQLSYENKTKLDVLENDYLNKIDKLNHRIDMLYHSIEKLTEKIEKLSERI